jgi:hypothetical protein
MKCHLLYFRLNRADELQHSTSSYAFHEITKAELLWNNCQVWKHKLIKGINFSQTQQLLTTK